MTAHEVAALAQIHQLLAKCAQAGDTRRAEDYAGCFTADGVLQLAHETITGQDAIAAWMHAPSPIPPPPGAAPGFVSHHLTTCHVIFADLQSATARTYWLVMSAAGLDHSGYYVDQLRCVDAAWRISCRRPRTLWVSPSSVLHQR